MTKPSRAISRCNSAETFGGSAEPSGVCSVARRSAALRRVGLKLRMPSRARVPFIRLTMRVRSPTRRSRSRLGRLASSSAMVGTRAMVQWPRSPRSHPKNPRFSNSVSSRSVLARRCSRDTATLEAWITCASTPRALSQRANQKPSWLEGVIQPLVLSVQARASAGIPLRWREVEYDGGEIRRIGVLQS